MCIKPPHKNLSLIFIEKTSEKSLRYMFVYFVSLISGNSNKCPIFPLSPVEPSIPVLEAFLPLSSSPNSSWIPFPPPSSVPRGAVFLNPPLASQKGAGRVDQWAVASRRSLRRFSKMHVFQRQWASPARLVSATWYKMWTWEREKTTRKRNGFICFSATFFSFWKSKFVPLNCLLDYILSEGNRVQNHLLTDKQCRWMLMQ